MTRPGKFHFSRERGQRMSFTLDHPPIASQLHPYVEKPLREHFFSKIAQKLEPATDELIYEDIVLIRLSSVHLITSATESILWE
jgi:hypothetical protein